MWQGAFQSTSLWPPQIEAVKQTHRHLGFERDFQGLLPCVVAKLPNGRAKGNVSSWLEGRLKERVCLL